MIKGFVLLTKRPDLTHEQFCHHWRTVHAPLARRLKNLRRYVQAYAISEKIPGFTAIDCNGIAQIWYDDLASALRLADDPDYREGLHQDEPNFLDMDNIRLLFTLELPIIDGPAGRLKAIFLVRRKAGMSIAAFQDYWRNRHAPMVHRTPGLMRYVQCHVPSELYLRTEPPFDGVAELWWQDLQQFRQAWRSDVMREEQARDLAGFIDLNVTCGLLVRETAIF